MSRRELTKLKPALKQVTHFRCTAPFYALKCAAGRLVGFYYASLSLIAVPVEAVETAALFDLLPLQNFKSPYFVGLCKRAGDFIFKCQNE